MPEIPIVQSPSNLGYAGAFNLGADFALRELKPDYLWLLNNDTIVDRACPAEMLAASRRLGPAIISPKILQWDDHSVLWYAGGYLEPNLKSHHIGRDEPDRGQYDETRVIPWASGCSLFVSVESLRTIGPMSDLYFLYLEDVDWCLQAAKRGVPTYFVPQAKLYHGISKSVDMLDRRASVYYGWRNYYYLAFRNGSLRQRLGALGDLTSRLLKTVVRLSLQPSARQDAMYGARSTALVDVVRHRTGPAPYSTPQLFSRPAISEAVWASFRHGSPSRGGRRSAGRRHRRSSSASWR